MLINQDIVVFSDNWHGLPTAAMHLVRQLAARNRVFWFNMIGRLPRWARADARKIWTTASSWVRGSGPTCRPRSLPADNVRVFNPIMIPYFRPSIRRLNQRLFAALYRRIQRQYVIRHPLVVATLPCTVDFVHTIDAARLIYYCMDDYLSYPGLDHRRWAILERELLERADGVAVTSHELARKLTRRCPLLYLPHGVDVDHFRRHSNERESARLTVGFFGLIDQWVDLSAIASLSGAFPEVDFVLIGKSVVSLDPLRRLQNVRYLGYRPYAALPASASRFDVGLIPFKLTELTRAVNPLKLLEYFALGLPVLASPLPELEKTRGPLWLAGSHDDFRQKLTTILCSDFAALAAQARACAEQHTWQRRAASFAQFVRHDLGVRN
jgi:glycosyltransferase involved in cell wall biosynthesis